MCRGPSRKSTVTALRLAASTFAAQNLSNALRPSAKGAITGQWPWDTSSVSGTVEVHELRPRELANIGWPPRATRRLQWPAASVAPESCPAWVASLAPQNVSNDRRRSLKVSHHCVWTTQPMLATGICDSFTWDGQGLANISRVPAHRGLRGVSVMTGPYPSSPRKSRVMVPQHTANLERASGKVSVPGSTTTNGPRPWPAAGVGRFHRRGLAMMARCHVAGAAKGLLALRDACTTFSCVPATGEGEPQDLSNRS